MIAISNLTFHRNGSFGASYYAARIAWRGDGKRYKGVAIVFDAPEHVAVMADSGEHFRCEDFEGELRAFIHSPQGQRMAFPHMARNMIGD